MADFIATVSAVRVMSEHAGGMPATGCSRMVRVRGWRREGARERHEQSYTSARCGGLIVKCRLCS